jgi:hypothetical protein
MAEYTPEYVLIRGQPLLHERTPTLIARGHSDGSKYGGNYRISDVVTRKGIAGQHRVDLYDYATREFVKYAYSDAETGIYTFDHIANRTYFTVAHDTEDPPLNAAIADLIQPEPMS